MVFPVQAIHPFGSEKRNFLLLVLHGRYGFVGTWGRRFYFFEGEINGSRLASLLNLSGVDLYTPNAYTHTGRREEGSYFRTTESLESNFGSGRWLPCAPCTLNLGACVRHFGMSLLYSSPASSTRAAHENGDRKSNKQPNK